MAPFFTKIGFFQLAGFGEVEIIIESMKILLSCISIFFTALIIANAGDWPSWRGPARDDVSMEKGLLKSWASNGPEKVWMSNDAGLGYAGFSIANGALYTMGAFGGTEKLIAYRAVTSSSTNKKVWELINSSVALNTKFGDASISSKHCNFLVNKNNATFNDMQKLIYHIKNEVKKKTGIEIQLEIVLVE